MDGFGIVSIPVIVVLCFLIGNAWKTANSLDDKWIPCVCGASGLILGVLIWLTDGVYHVDWFGIGDRRINLCDTVRVVHPDLHLSSTAKVVETKYNTLVEQYDELTIGSIQKTIVDTVAKLIGG